MGFQREACGAFVAENNGRPSTGEQFGAAAFSRRYSQHIESVGRNIYFQIDIPVVEIHGYQQSCIASLAQKCVLTVGIEVGIVVIHIHEIEECSVAQGVFPVDEVEHGPVLLQQYRSSLERGPPHVPPS